MPTLQIRDMPDDVFQAVAAAARIEQRSLSQQAIVELRRALTAGDGGDRRALVLDYLATSARRLPAGAVTPDVLVREDRESR